MNGSIGAVIILSLFNAILAIDDPGAIRQVDGEKDLPLYLQGGITFDELGLPVIHGFNEEKPDIVLDVLFVQEVPQFHVCNPSHSKCGLPVPAAQRAVICFEVYAIDPQANNLPADCPPGMTGIEFKTDNAKSGKYYVWMNPLYSPKVVNIEVNKCVQMIITPLNHYHHNVKISSTVSEDFLVKRLLMVDFYALEKFRDMGVSKMYMKNTNTKCGLHLKPISMKIATREPKFTDPPFFNQGYQPLAPSTLPADAPDVENNDETTKAVATAQAPVLKIVFIVVGVVVIICFIFVFFFLLWQRRKRKEYQAQSLSDKTPPLILPKGSSNDAVAPVAQEKTPVRTPAPSAEMQSTPAPTPQVSTPQVSAPAVEKQKSATVSAMTAVPPPRGLRAMRTADELYRLALTADVRVERNVYLDMAIESANDEIRAWEKSPAGKRNDPTVLPLVAQRILSARQRKLSMLQSKIPNRLLPEQVDGLSYEDINDLALLEMKSMNIRYALFDMACDAIKRAYEEAYATANFEKEAVDPLVYQVQLGVLELNEEPLRVAEQRRRLVEEYLRLKGIIVKEGFSKSR